MSNANDFRSTYSDVIWVMEDMVNGQKAFAISATFFQLEYLRVFLAQHKGEVYPFIEVKERYSRFGWSFTNINLGTILCGVLL